MYDCFIVGGGIAGLQAAIQLGRYKHRIAVADAKGGRSSLCQDYHNVLGWDEGVSGKYLRNTGHKQARKLGVHFYEDVVKAIERREKGFYVYTKRNPTPFYAKRILLATGIRDRLPPFPELKPCLGKSVYICPDCDGFEICGHQTIVIGSGNPGAHLTLELLYWNSNLIYINHEQKVIDPYLQRELDKQGIPNINEPVVAINKQAPDQITSVVLANGQEISASKAFLAMGGAQVEADLAKQLGVELLESQHILVNPRTKETNITHVWAAGDATVHSQLLTIAMGDGAQAAVWIHKSLINEVN
ncbi:NAD(P)/FAD-dependent oxidoreductase [Halalkalibacterium ligniniphilum]|uniref:NAD(P)/FAD-dependent oxidoreductase n=1 Tax=Halalkalibacterium ligniniphilum TaxID=1134413 RepID=UPI00034A8FE3|nr:NAD(P)/FAD-dependent oxidoreductase [Halalkalibacterium ligniniphilum]